MFNARRFPFHGLLGSALSFAFAAAGFVLLVSGCNPKYYAPNTHNVPLLQQKGNGVATFAAGEARAELQGAYAVTKNLAIMLNLASFKPKNDEEGDGGKGQLVEAGLGYYRGFSKNFVFETYGLASIGDVENHFPSSVTNNPTTTGKIESKLFRIGVQSAVGFTSKYFDVAASTRLTALNYHDISGSLIFGGEDQVAYLQGQDKHVLFEPALTLRGGYKSLKLQIQLGHSFNLSHSDFQQDDGHFTIGVGYHLRK
ncbi:MAG TPA: hypothetical protein VGA99_12030 [bacterium]